MHVKFFQIRNVFPSHRIASRHDSRFVKVHRTALKPGPPLSNRVPGSQTGSTALKAGPPLSKRVQEPSLRQGRVLELLASHSAQHPDDKGGVSDSPCSSPPPFQLPSTVTPCSQLRIWPFVGQAVAGPTLTCCRGSAEKAARRGSVSSLRSVPEEQARESAATLGPQSCWGRRG